MTRTPAALALSLAVTAFARTGGAEPCAPRAELTGDRDAVVQVSAELAKLGVGLGGGTAACPGVQATVELAREGGISVAVRDRGARSEGRVVSDAAVAATWIDAWVRDDLDVAAWAPPPGAAPPLAVALAPHAEPVDEAPRPRSSLAARAIVTAGFAIAGTSDGASWRGFDAGACMLVGNACIGARVSALWQPDTTSASTAFARSDLSAEAIASHPFVAGNAIFTPEVGAGVGRMATRRLDGCQPAMPPPNGMCDPSDPTCVMPPASCQPDSAGNLDPSTGKGLFVGDHFSTATWTPRLSVAMRVAVRLFSRVYLDGLASYSLMPFAHTDVFASSSPPPGTTADQIAVPGEPNGGWLLGVGLRVGAP